MFSFLNFGRKSQHKQACKLFDSCEITPLSVFKSCLINNDLSSLVISGSVDPETLDKTWSNLWYEYCDLVGERQYRQIFELLKEINYQKNRLTALECAVISIENGHTSKDIEHVLRSNGYNPADLEMCKRRMKSINITIEQLTKELESKKDEKQTETINKQRMNENFTDSVLMLQKFGFVIDLNKTTVFEYARMKKNYNAEIEYYKSLKNGSKGKD